MCSGPDISIVDLKETIREIVSSEIQKAHTLLVSALESPQIFVPVKVYCQFHGISRSVYEAMRATGTFTEENRYVPGEMGQLTLAN